MLFLKTAIVLMLSLAVADAPSHKIALDTVWGYGIPGTKDVRKLQKVPYDLSKVELLQQSLVAQIHWELYPRNLPELHTAFVVKGADFDALKETARVLAERHELKDKKEPELIQPLDTELSLVFYTYLCGAYVHVTDIERSGNVITVKYRFETHLTNDMTTHFALIPLGKDLKGTVRVKIVEEPPVDRWGNNSKVANQTRNKISSSFTFRTQ